MPGNKRLPTPYRTLSRRIVWSSPWFSVRQDDVVFPDGSSGAFNVVQHPGAIWVIPVTHQGEIVLLYQYRYTVDDWCWEIPAGGVKPGQSDEEAVVQELREEIGGVAEDIHYFGSFYTANGICDEVARIYIATGVSVGRPDHEPAEVMEIHLKPIDEVLRMARANEISDGPSALALILCENVLRQYEAF